ncbi:hypothetical protein [Rhodoferax ferrireducens]|uniref:hypothetical protein n=1 Tax=Rhodoferax ferrireducens TaxID=192843 RepID=UPI000E0D85FD|nr:hypothetical protein [Rhodoferax ferrireducens]
MSNNAHPPFSPLIYSKKPRFAVTSCSHCGQTFGAGNHGSSDCREADRIAADLAANYDKAHRLNNEAFIKSMQEQIQRNLDLRGIA